MEKNGIPAPAPKMSAVTMTCGVMMAGLRVSDEMAAVKNLKNSKKTNDASKPYLAVRIAGATLALALSGAAWAAGAPLLANATSPTPGDAGAWPEAAAGTRHRVAAASKALRRMVDLPFNQV